MWRSNSKPDQKNPRTELFKRGVNPNYTLSNKCNAADLVFLFQESLSLTIKRLPFNSNTNLLFSLIGTPKLSKDVEGLQSNWCFKQKHYNCTILHIQQKTVYRLTHILGVQLSYSSYSIWNCYVVNFNQIVFKHVWMRLKLDLYDCWSQDITIAVCVSDGISIDIVLFIQPVFTHISSRVLLHYMFC